MIEELSLWNIGGVRRAALSFGPGLTVITGESGAGKSSVVRALELAAGRRGDAQLLRAGEEEGGAEARFRLDAPLPEGDDSLPLEEGVLRARRLLARSRPSRASLQGAQVSLTAYSNAVSRLIHIQSQFAQMTLLEGERQLAMIDSCTPPSVREAAAELRRAFDQARARDGELRAMTQRRDDIERRYANANEVLNLIRRVAPEPGLEASLEASLSELARRIARRERARVNLDRLFGGLSEQGLLGGVRSAFESLLEALPRDEGREARRSVEEGLHLLEEAADRARDALEGEGDDLQERDRVEARLGALRRLRRLSGTEDEAALLEWGRDAAESLTWLEENYHRFEELSRESLDLKRRANALAMELRRGRQAAAAELAEGVSALLGDLAMGGTAFEVHFRELDKLRRGGADEVEFALRSGQRVGRVDKVASGGELSRLLLALQLALPDQWLPPTLVFDEVEAGLGGRAAVLSGMKLKELSRRCQVILVTHEASIAALGDAHILVQRVEGESQIRPVEGEERAREIARMLSGSPDLEEARRHARTLLGRGPGL